MDTAKTHSNGLEKNENSEPLLYRRRLQDIRIWRHINEKGFERVAVRLCQGYKFICWGGRMRTSSWSEKISRSYHQDVDSFNNDSLDYLMHCKKDYLHWADACEQEGVNHRAVMEIIFFGRNTTEVERMFRHRHGWALKNMMQAFELYRK